MSSGNNSYALFIISRVNKIDFIFKEQQSTFFLYKCTYVLTKTGCVINDTSANHVFYADDLCIMSAGLAGSQKLIDILCYSYSVQNSLTFNPTKSVCMVFKPKKFKLYCPPMV